MGQSQCFIDFSDGDPPTITLLAPDSLNYALLCFFFFFPNYCGKNELCLCSPGLLSSQERGVLWAQGAGKDGEFFMTVCLK